MTAKKHQCLLLAPIEAISFSCGDFSLPQEKIQADSGTLCCKNAKSFCSKKKTLIRTLIWNYV